MSNGRNYNRERNGKRFLLEGGLDTVHPPDIIKEGSYPYIQNVRRSITGRITDRPLAGAPLYTLAGGGYPNAIVRMNDSTPSGPPGGFTRIISSGGYIYANTGAPEAARGLSGNPPSIVPFGPNQSVQPWAYIGDASQLVVIVDTGQACTGMIKIRSDGLTYKTGGKEPQQPPIAGVSTSSVTQYLTLPANTPPWTNVGAVNGSYNYNGTDVQPPFPAVIFTPVAGSTVTLTVTGTATVNGSLVGPASSQPASSNYPGAFISSPVAVVYAFTDSNGNVLAQSTAVGAPNVVGNVGAGVVVTVPTGAAQLQLGIDSQGGHFSANSGSYQVRFTVSTTSVAAKTAIVGNVQAYIWGDSPHSGPTAEYIWNNPNDPKAVFNPRTIGTAQATATNNSLIFGSNAGGVQDDPQNGTGPVQWTTLNPDGSVAGVVSLFDPALESAGYQDFNCCNTGSLFFPSGGTFAITIVTKDQVMFGMGGGVTSDSGVYQGSFQQTITVANALPILFASTPNGEGGAVTTSFNLTVPTQGVYQFELDWDYWYHQGRQLQVTIAATAGGSATTIPPLPAGTRTNTVYWGKYRSSATGAQSNPGPPSPVLQTPVLANTLTMTFYNDPQFDKCDYYRQDSGLANPTYVITGPNDGLGQIINGVLYNTTVTDTLTDLAAATNPIMATDDFEPFPSIDTPKSGKVTIVDGVVTWKSGDQFNIRWLPGTLMLIGSPSQNAYSLVARPLSPTQIVIPDIPDTIGDAAGDGVQYNIAQPILAQQPVQSLWGPDAFGYMHACGDTNQPEAYLWTKANNPDSAPQTNRMLLTSPSDPLMGGGIVNGVSMAFSTLRAWLMNPNFADAQATTEGTIGNPWIPMPATVTRGLYIRNCLCSIGGKAIAYRASDGICVTSGGPEKSLTDDQLYNLFPHENFVPKAVSLGPYAVYPPNDNYQQTLVYQQGFIYYDYTGTTPAPSTGVVSTLSNPAVIIGNFFQSSWVGLTMTINGSPYTVVTVFSSTEIQVSPAIGSDLFDLSYSINAPGVALCTLVFQESAKGWIVDVGNPNFTVHGADYGPGVSETVVGCSDSSIRVLGPGGTEVITSAIATPADNAGDARALKRVADVFVRGVVGSSSPVDLVFYSGQYGSVLSGLSPNVLTGAGALENYIIDSAGAAIDIPDLAMTLSWTTGGGNELDLWQPVMMPLPAGILSRRTDGISVGRGYQHVYLVNATFAATAAVTLTLNTDQGVFARTWPPSGTLGVLTRVMEKMPPNKFKVCEYQITSSAEFYLFGFEIWVGPWGRDGAYEILRPFEVSEVGM